MRKLALQFALAVSWSALMTAQPAAAATEPDALSVRMGSCLYKRFPARAHELLGATTLAESDREYGHLANEKTCVERVVGEEGFSPGELPLPKHLMRGALAEQALRGMAGQVRSLAALPVKQGLYERPWFVATGRNAAIDDMAACVADTDPAGIAALLESKPGSFDEGAAMARMKPSLTTCLAAGTRMEADSRPVRAALADALYQRVSNPGLSLAQVGETAK